MVVDPGRFDGLYGSGGTDVADDELTAPAADRALLLKMVDDPVVQSGYGWPPMQPEAIVFLKRGEVWTITAAFQSVFRASRFFAQERYDKPVAMVYREQGGWDVVYRNA